MMVYFLTLIVCVCVFMCVKESEEKTKWIVLCKMQSFFMSNKGVWHMYNLVLLSFITRKYTLNG